MFRTESRESRKMVKEVISGELQNLRKGLRHDLHEMRGELKNRFEELSHFVRDVQKQILELRVICGKTREDVKRHNHQQSEFQDRFLCFP